MYTRSLLATLLFSIPCYAGDKQDIPDALRRAIEFRMKPRTGYVKYVVNASQDTGVPRETWFEQRFAGENVYIIEKGDASGIVLREPDGTPLFGVRNACLPSELLVDRKQGRVFVHAGSYTHLASHESNEGQTYVDIRTMGFHWAPQQMLTVQDVFRPLIDRNDCQISSRKLSNNLIEVSALTSPIDETNGSGMSWTIDPARNYSINEIKYFEIEPKGERFIRCKTLVEHEKVDGYWWPILVDSSCETSGYRNTIQTYYIELDRPDHPRRLDADFLGAPPGTPVFGSQFLTRPARYVGGGQVISDDEWEKIKGDYDRRDLDAWILKQKAKGSGTFPLWWNEKTGTLGLEGVASAPEEWEIYVHRWLSRHSNAAMFQLTEPLDDRQKTAALAILEDCRKQARPLAERRDAKLRAARARVGESERLFEKLSKSTNSEETTLVSSAREAVQVAKADLLLTQNDSELIALFDSLKSRLEGLLTARQKTQENTVDPHEARPPANKKGTSTVRPILRGQ